jgi:hypothetical protein
MVFDNAGQMALRIGSWQNEDTWEELGRLYNTLGE